MFVAVLFVLNAHVHFVVAVIVIVASAYVDKLHDTLAEHYKSVCKTNFAGNAI